MNEIMKDYFESILTCNVYHAGTGSHLLPEQIDRYIERVNNNSGTRVGLQYQSKNGVKNIMSDSVIPDKVYEKIESVVFAGVTNDEELQVANNVYKKLCLKLVVYTLYKEHKITTVEKDRKLKAIEQM